MIKQFFEWYINEKPTLQEADVKAAETLTMNEINCVAAAQDFASQVLSNEHGCFISPSVALELHPTWVRDLAIGFLQVVTTARR